MKSLPHKLQLPTGFCIHDSQDTLHWVRKASTLYLIFTYVAVTGRRETLLSRVDAMTLIDVSSTKWQNRGRSAVLRA
jgi:hypothetical protein